MNRSIHAFLSLAVAVAATSGMAQNAKPASDAALGPYVGGAFGAFGANASSNNLVSGPSNLSKNNSGYKVLGGYQLTEKFGVEAGLLRSSTLKRSFVVNGSNVVQSGDVNSIYVAATARLPVSESIALRSKLGVAKSNFSGKNVLPAASSIIGGKTGVIAGVGAEYRVTPSIAATLDYDYLPKTSKNFKSAITSVGIKVGF